VLRAARIAAWPETVGSRPAFSALRPGSADMSANDALVAAFESMRRCSRHRQQMEERGLHERDG
jgi:hypothetical protein